MIEKVLNIRSYPLDRFEDLKTLDIGEGCGSQKLAPVSDDKSSINARG